MRVMFFGLWCAVLMCRIKAVNGEVWNDIGD